MVKIVDRDGNPYKTMMDHQEPAEVQVAQAMEAAGIKPPPKISGSTASFTASRQKTGMIPDGI